MNPIISTQDLNLHYGDFHALKSISMDMNRNTVTALIGPSGCGKSTYLRCFNRMNDLVDDVKIEGKIEIEGKDIYKSKIDVVDLRRNVGMVFQKPNPFPKSIFDNVAYGPKLHGLARDKYDMEEIVENSVRKAGLWDEVKDRLNQPGTGLSGGQQQRLCIARAISVKPQILLMDEPASALDPIATMQLEETMFELKKNYTIIIVTHNMQQAARASDYTAFFYLGDLIEYDKTANVFQNAKLKSTSDYVSGHFG